MAKKTSKDIRELLYKIDRGRFAGVVSVLPCLA